MPLLINQTPKPIRQRTLRKARSIMRMLQGTMGLEGQALDRQALRVMMRRTVEELLAPGR